MFTELGTVATPPHRHAGRHRAPRDVAIRRSVLVRDSDSRSSSCGSRDSLPGFLPGRRGPFGTPDFLPAARPRGRGTCLGQAVLVLLLVNGKLRS